MKLFVIPVPLFDKDIAVNSYYFRYLKGENLLLFNQAPYHLGGGINSELIEILNDIGLESFTNGKPIFVPITNLHLISDMYKISKTPPQNVILRINYTVTAETIYIERIKLLKSLGYRFALNLPNDFELYHPIIELMDYIIVNQVASNKKNALNLLSQYPKHISVASHINTNNMFNLAKATGYDLFEGSFYRVPLTVGENSLSPLKISSIKLLNVVKDLNFDIDEVSKIVEQDTSLAISLLKLVNLHYLSKGQQIKTISQAAAMLGQTELRKWVSAAASTALSADKPNEINKLSLIRAKFAEELAPLFGLKDDSESLFLMGLFSVLDVVLDKSIGEALDIVSVSDNIKNALVQNAGPYYPIYEFMLFYEMAEWTSVSRIIILNNIEVESIFKAYITTLTWYRDLISWYNVDN